MPIRVVNGQHYQCNCDCEMCEKGEHRYCRGQVGNCKPFWYPEVS